MGVFMRPLTHIGEALAEVDGREYLVRPSFRALSLVEDLESHIEFICVAYQTMLLGGQPSIGQLSMCANVIEACSDLPPEWLGECVERSNGWRYKVTKLSMRELVVIAHHCIKWGVYGDPKEKLSKAAKERLEKEPKTEFDPHTFVAVMVDEFGMTSSEAWGATMVEFQRLCEHRQRKNWGDRPAPVSDEERDDLRAKYQAFLQRKKELAKKGELTVKKGRK